MRKTLINFILSVGLLMLSLFSALLPTYSFWNNLHHTVDSIIITTGNWNFIPSWDPEEDYTVGDTFIYDDSIWIITASWFDNSQFINPDGSINTEYLYPYGPVEENTLEWRSYNTYYEGDVVLHEGYSWIVRHEGANSVEPGSDTNAWNRLDPNWFMYNTYEKNEITTYNGQQWKALKSNRNRIPGQVSWAWELIG